MCAPNLHFVMIGSFFQIANCDVYVPVFFAVLDDILNCIFDQSASFPMWYWCNICSHAEEPSIATSVTVSACFKFLRTLAYSNFKVQKRYVHGVYCLTMSCGCYITFMYQCWNLGIIGLVFQATLKKAKFAKAL